MDYLKDHPSMRAYIVSIEHNTGLPLGHWVSFAKERLHLKHKEIVDVLKSEFGFGNTHAHFVVHIAKGTYEEAKDEEALLESQYTDSQGFIDLYFKIEKWVLAHENAKREVKKAYVSFKTKKTFLMVKPARNHIDIGFNLRGFTTDVLTENQKFHTMCTHVFRITAPEQLESIKAYITEAYHLNT